MGVVAIEILTAAYKVGVGFVFCCYFCILVAQLGLEKNNNAYSLHKLHTNSSLHLIIIAVAANWQADLGRGKQSLRIFRIDKRSRTE